MKDFMKSLFGRRVLIPIAVIGLLGLFLGLYYLVYMPREQGNFNRAAFRMLGHIAFNFKDRIENYSTSIVTADILKEYDQQVVFTPGGDIPGSLIKAARQPVIGDANRDSLYTTGKILRNDSIIFSIRSNSQAKQNDTGKAIREILEPIINIRNNIFESVILVTGEQAADQTNAAKAEGQAKQAKFTSGTNAAAKALLYSSGNLAVDQDIVIDSLLTYSGGFLLPVVKDMPLEGVRYKLFLYPFRIDNHRYLIGGFISLQQYRSLSQDFPLKYLVVIGMLILVALLSLPFLKVFLIGSGENITIKDVRAIIAMLFILPFLFVLLLSAFWIHRTESSSSTTVLKQLHGDIASGFTNEISDCLRQLHAYETLYAATDSQVVSLIQSRLRPEQIREPNPVNLRNTIFFPSHYMNMDGVFWINNRGVEIEKWNLVKITSPFLYLSQRQYFKNIQTGDLNKLTVQVDSSDGLVKKPLSFSIQPTLSKATGNYTVNIVKPTNMQFDSRAESRAILIGISAKMYTVFKPVVPKGYNFCIVNSEGDILFHSESERSLQENLFAEAGDNEALVNAVTNRDSAQIEAALYQREVKAFTSPLKGLPYQLVTYYNKRNDYLFNIHVIAFTFLTESLILLSLGIFILLFYYITRKQLKLYFSPDQFDWIKPGHEKLRFYKTLIYFQLILLAVVCLMLMLITADQRINFIMQASLLFPLSIACGYYMFRSSETMARVRRQELLLNAMQNRQANNEKTEAGVTMHTRTGSHTSDNDPPGAEKWYQENAFKKFSGRMIKILLAFVIALVLFSVLKMNIQERSAVDSDPWVDGLLTMLFLLIPIGSTIAATWYYYYITQRQLPAQPKKSNYMRYLAIAVMLSVLLISILPTLGLLLFAYEQETSLQTKAAQMYLAKEIQQHRSFINEKVSRAKFDSPDHYLHKETAAYIRNLKFSSGYGLYLSNHRLQEISVLPSVDSNKKHYNSVMYKQVTDYLFLPADHFDFYNNTRDYFWQSVPNGRNKDSIRKDRLTLFYANLTDPKHTSSIAISSDIPHTLPLIRKLEWNEILLFLLILLLFFFFLYSIFLSIAKRVFLIGYFEGRAIKDQDPSLINRLLKEQELNEFDRNFWLHSELTLQMITEKENECHISHQDYPEWVIRIETMLAPSYEKIWQSLTSAERSVLYDFALDGFTNYRNIGILYSLYKKSLIKKHKNHLKIMTDSFRNYLISKTGTAEIKDLQRTVSEGGKWGNLRALFYVVLFAIVLFLFITREDISKRVLTIVTALAAIIPLLLKLFDPSSPSKSKDNSAV